MRQKHSETRAAPLYHPSIGSSSPAHIRKIAQQNPFFSSLLEGRTATAYSIVPSRSPFVSEHAPDGA